MGSKKNFWKGLFVGAGAMFIICLFIGGVGIGILSFSDIFHSSTENNETYESGVVTEETLKKIEEIQEIIDRDYLYIDDVDKETIQDAIIHGYVAGLKEPYSVYYSAEEAKELFETTSGTFGGIGVGIQQDRTTGLITFTTIYKNAPGEKAGFKSGDIVYKVNGEDVSAQDLDTVVSKIRGEIGTTVEITVLRGDSRKEYTAKATRALIENSTVVHEMKDNKVGYIQITGFEDVTYKQFEKAMTELKSEGMKSLVIDLRNNPGGNLSTVCEMLDLILPKGNIVSIKDRSGNAQSFSSDSNTILDVPLVVLINGFSASASEIFAGAVQDYEIGTIVGTTTYGKGVVQNVYQLKDGTALKITSSEYFTAKGRNIHGKGIEPDVKIEYKYDEANPNADNQLEKALEILKKGM